MPLVFAQTGSSLPKGGAEAVVWLLVASVIIGLYLIIRRTRIKTRRTTSISKSARKRSTATTRTCETSSQYEADPRTWLSSSSHAVGGRQGALRADAGFRRPPAVPPS